MWRSRPTWVAATVLLGTVVSALMQTFLTISLPVVTTEVGAERWYGWFAGLYLAAATVFVGPLASLTDRWGPRVVYLGSMTVWVAATAGLAAAEGTAALLGLRVVQGIGAAGIVPAGVAALAYTYRENFGRMVGAVGAVQAFAMLAGAPLGGWASDVVGWRGSLWVIASLSILPLILAAVVLPTTAGGKGRGGMRRVLRTEGAVPLLLMTMALAAMSFGVATYLPLLLGRVYQLDPSTIGLLATPGLVGVAVGAAIGGARAERPSTEFLSSGVLVAGAGVALVPHPYAAAVGGLAVALGAGVGFSRQVVLLQRLAPSDAAGSVGGLTHAARNIGGAAATLLLGLPMQLGVEAAAGASIAFVAMFVFAVFVNAASAVGRRRPAVTTLESDG